MRVDPDKSEAENMVPLLFYLSQPPPFTVPMDFLWNLPERFRSSPEKNKVPAANRTR